MSGVGKRSERSGAVETAAGREASHNPKTTFHRRATRGPVKESEINGTENVEEGLYGEV